MHAPVPKSGLESSGDKWRERLLYRLLYGRGTDRGAKAKARVALAIAAFAAVYAVIAGRLVMDIARTQEQRQVLSIFMGMKALGRPYFVAPDAPKDRTDALRSAFMETMRGAARNALCLRAQRSREQCEQSRTCRAGCSYWSARFMG